MRIKTLVCLAALTAGVATSMAQSNVYSLNIVGYVTKTNTSGFSMIANPLQSTNNDMKVLFSDAPDNSKVFRFQGGAYVLYFKDADDGWSGPGGPGDSFLLNPGEGIFFQHPGGSPYVKTFVGEVVLNSTNPIPNGFAIRSSVVPQAGKVQTDLLYPAGVNDKIFKWSGTAYVLYFNDVDDGWTGPGGVEEPTLAVAESAFFQNAGTAKSWIRNFTVGP
jgi:hypothetical protein